MLYDLHIKTCHKTLYSVFSKEILFLYKKEMLMERTAFDLTIIGSGPGGYIAAIRASQLGRKVALIEAENLGGICLNWGCIPTKALLRSAEIYDHIQHASDYGFKVEKTTINFSKIIERSRAVAAQLSKGVESLMKKNKVTVFRGRGSLAGAEDGVRKVLVQKSDGKSETLLSKTVILATGARARFLPNLKANEYIWTYREAMMPQELPKTLLVIGSGAIGVEFASFYCSLGVQVTIVELMDRILPVEDEEISKLARKALEKRGIKIMTEVTLDSLEKKGKSLIAAFKQENKGHTVEFDRAILAVGIDANIENLGLENTKIKIEKGRVVTNEWCQTHEPGVYAIGDMTDGPWLAHKASHEGVLAVEHCSGNKKVHALRKTLIPGCTYSTPQVASLGLTEKQALDQGYEIKVGRFPFMANGKAIALGEPEGLVKTIFDKKTGELLGAHMIGTEVTELIQGFAIAKTAELTEEELMQTVFPHPTLSEMMHESVLSAYGRTLNF